MSVDRLRAFNERHNPVSRRRWSSYRDPLALVRDHFAQRSSLEHINYSSMRDTIALLGGQPQVILETGSSAWGTDSTRLWDAYVRSFGGELWSVDLREEPRERLRGLVGRHTRLVCDDSVAFLGTWAADHPGVQAGLVYLDSYDVDFTDPMPAAEHCVAELAAALPTLGPGSLVLVDDSPGTREDMPEEWRDTGDAVFERLGLWPGKGMLLDGWLAEHEVAHEKLHHRYQVLYRF